MLERVFHGSKGYWAWVAFLALIALLGGGAYTLQFSRGLAVTGMGRDVSWGLYIGQFTFLVGVAASAVMVTLPYYFHQVKAFSRMVLFGEFVAVSAVVMCLLFILVDLGQPMRLFNIILYPTPHSILFWDMVVLTGYLVLNLVSGWAILEAENKAVPPPAWVGRLAYVSVPWAISIHTVTAFLYAGLPDRHYWLTALMAARFLASAFAAGPALLILLALALRRAARIDLGREAIQGLRTIMTYAMLISLFFVGLELFTAFYSQVPLHMQSFRYLFAGLDGSSAMVAPMWSFVVLAVAGAVLLLLPRARQRESTLAVAAALVFVSLWIEKGFGLVVGGFVPNPFDRVTPYWPTGLELLISAGIWALGLLLLTLLCKLVVTVRREAQP